jgi:hypothetical protein
MIPIAFFAGFLFLYTKIVIHVRYIFLLAMICNRLKTNYKATMGKIDFFCSS